MDCLAGWFWPEVTVTVLAGWSEGLLPLWLSGGWQAGAGYWQEASVSCYMELHRASAPRVAWAEQRVCLSETCLLPGTVLRETPAQPLQVSSVWISWVVSKSDHVYI